MAHDAEPFCCASLGFKRKYSFTELRMKNMRPTPSEDASSRPIPKGMAESFFSVGAITSSRCPRSRRTADPTSHVTTSCCLCCTYLTTSGQSSVRMTTALGRAG